MDHLLADLEETGRERVDFVKCQLHRGLRVENGDLVDMILLPLEEALDREFVDTDGLARCAGRFRLAGSSSQTSGFFIARFGV